MAMAGGAVQARWELRDRPPPEAESALAEYPPIQRRILYGRGVGDAATAARFLRRESEARDDPFILSGMEAAADRLGRAARAGERVVVYGDYDADGVCATALLCAALEAGGARAQPYIPDRFSQGYGVHAEALQQLHDDGARLVVTVDCGVRSVEEAERARRLGLDLIITDHHEPGAELPPALAVIDPRQPGDAYPFKGLAGVGLAYKLAQALAQRLGGPAPNGALDLVAVGTVADVAPLISENRRLVHEGLRRLRGEAGGARAGLQALVHAAGYQARVDASAIGFGLGPRLNAAGRMGRADDAYRLLTAHAPDEAQRLAGALNSANQRRQDETARAVEFARAQVLEQGLPALIALLDERFHRGVLGLAAGRLAEEFYRPALLAAPAGALVHGSARSIGEFPITQALDACAGLLMRHGGHRTAAGFTLRRENWEALCARLGEQAESSLGGKELRPVLRPDAEVGFDEIDWDLVRFLDALEPCGEGNPPALLLARAVEVLEARAVGADRSHLKLRLRRDGRAMNAIAFRRGALADQLPARVDLVFRPVRNEFREQVSLELQVVDLRAPG